MLFGGKDGNEITSFTYVAPPGQPGKNSEIEEESKDVDRLLNTENGSNDELFKHLSYLSQLNQDVSKHQQVDVPGPGEYKIKLFDSSSASPASAILQEKYNTTSKKADHRGGSSSFEQDMLTTMQGMEPTTPTRTGGRARSRMSTHFNRLNSENTRPLTLRLKKSENTTDEALTPSTASEAQNNRFSQPFNRANSQVDGILGIRRIATETQIHDKSNLGASSRTNQQIRH